MDESEPLRGVSCSVCLQPSCSEWPEALSVGQHGSRERKSVSQFFKFDSYRLPSATMTFYQVLNANIWCDSSLLVVGIIGNA